MYKNWSIESQQILEAKILYQKNFNAKQLEQRQNRKRAVSLMREQKSTGGINNHVVFKVDKVNDNTGLRHSFSTFHKSQFIKTQGSTLRKRNLSPNESFDNYIEGTCFQNLSSVLNTAPNSQAPNSQANSPMNSTMSK